MPKKTTTIKNKTKEIEISKIIPKHAKNKGLDHTRFS